MPSFTYSSNPMLTVGNCRLSTLVFLPPAAALYMAPPLEFAEGGPRKGSVRIAPRKMCNCLNLRKTCPAHCGRPASWPTCRGKFFWSLTVNLYTEVLSVNLYEKILRSTEGRFDRRHSAISSGNSGDDWLVGLFASWRSRLPTCHVPQGRGHVLIERCTPFNSLFYDQFFLFVASQPKCE